MAEDNMSGQFSTTSDENLHDSRNKAAPEGETVCQEMVESTNKFDTFIRQLEDSKRKILNSVAILNTITGKLTTIKKLAQNTDNVDAFADQLMNPENKLAKMTDRMDTLSKEWKDSKKMLLQTTYSRQSNAAVKELAQNKDEVDTLSMKLKAAVEKLDQNMEKFQKRFFGN